MNLCKTDTGKTQIHVHVGEFLWVDTSRADSRLAPCQWETSLQSNIVSHWLGANLESALTSSYFGFASCNVICMVQWLLGWFLFLFQLTDGGNFICRWMLMSSCINVSDQDIVIPEIKVSPHQLNVYLFYLIFFTIKYAIFQNIQLFISLRPGDAHVSELGHHWCR